MTNPPLDPRFDAWCEEKKRLRARTPPPYFHPREIWWCAVGINVGFEEDGKGQDFSRPVLIVKKFGAVFYGIPLSTTDRRGPFYFPFTYKPGRGESAALLTHMRSFDSRRLLRKDGTMSQKDFQNCQAALAALFLGQ